MKFQIYDVVQLKCAKGGLVAGTQGTIVMAYEYPKEGYDVEFPVGYLKHLCRGVMRES